MTLSVHSSLFVLGKINQGYSVQSLLYLTAVDALPKMSPEKLIKQAQALTPVVDGPVDIQACGKGPRSKEEEEVDG